MNTAHKPSQRGFTLIELLVVMAIIAILATIGFITYNNVQSRARDTKRISELREMALSIESTKDPIKSTYIWTTTQVGNDFSKASVVSPYTAPYGDGYGNVYCVAVSTSTTSYTPPGPSTATAPWATDCTKAGASYSGIALAVNQQAVTPTPSTAVLALGTATSFTVCTYLENAINGSNNYCLTSQTK